MQEQGQAECLCYAGLEARAGQSGPHLLWADGSRAEARRVSAGTAMVMQCSVFMSDGGNGQHLLEKTEDLSSRAVATKSLPRDCSD